MDAKWSSGTFHSLLEVTNYHCSLFYRNKSLYIIPKGHSLLLFVRIKFAKLKVIPPKSLLTQYDTSFIDCYNSSQPFSVMFFYRNRNDFARTGISEALVLVIVTKTVHIILRVILETLILLTINLGVFLAWKKLHRKIGT